MEKIVIQINNTVSTGREKLTIFFFKNPSKHRAPSNVYYMKFYRSFLIEYFKLT